ncbi:MAG: phosphate uptake regulator PhoU [Nitrososphaeria archaeon]|nr:phosphate uptake regulator PhoU [Nitrososphaeria archaeon]
MRRVFKRSLTLTGGRSYSVVLPKDWVKTNNLRKGDALLIEVRDDGDLLLRPERAKRGERDIAESVTIPVGPLLQRDLIAAYLAGYDRIVVKSSEGIASSYREVVKRTVRSLTGAEVISEGHDVIEVQVLLDAGLIEPEKVLTRENALVVSNLSMVLEAVRRWDPDEAFNVIMMDEEVDRHYFTFVRVVRSYALGASSPRGRDLSPIRLLDMRVVAKFIEDVGDRVVKIAEVIKSNPIPPDPGSWPLIRLYEAASPLVKTQKGAFEAFLKNDSDLANSIIAEVSDVRQRISEVQAVGEVAPSRTHQLMFSELLRICDDQVDIADIAAPFPK